MKNAILYRLKEAIGFPQVMHEYRAPEGNEWRTVTFYNQAEEWMIARITERVLPSAAIKRYVAMKAAEFVEQNGQKANRTQKAIWKDEYVETNLPNAPMKDVFVPLYHNKDYLFVGTGSQAIADLVTSELRYNVFDDNLKIMLCNDDRRISAFLRNVMDGNTEYTLGDNFKFEHDNRKISFAGEMAESLAIDFYEAHNPRPVQVQFAAQDRHLIATLNEKGRFGSLTYDIAEGEEDAAKVFLTARALDELGNIMDACYEDDTL